MNVLILSQYFWPESFRITEVARTLKAMGNEVLVLTGQPNYPDGDVFNGYSACGMGSEFHEGIEIFRVPLFPRGRGSALRLVCNYFSFVFSAGLLGGWLLRYRHVDCILVYAPSPILQAIPAIWLGKIKSAKVITWVQDLWPESLSATGFVKNRWLLATVAKLVGWIYQYSDLLLAQSSAFIKPIQRLAGSTPVLFHPHPGELAFSIDCLRQPKVFLRPAFNIVFAGNLGTVQALDTIVEAACILRATKNIRFVLIGSGSRLQWLKDEISRLQLNNVELLGRFAADDMPPLLAQASVLLVSLIKDPIMSFTIPGKVQAYLAARKPIVASMDGEGARVVLEAGAGICAPAEDSVGLASAIMLMYQKPDEELARMGEAAGKYYDNNFEPRLLASRLTKILSNACGD